LKEKEVKILVEKDFLPKLNKKKAEIKNLLEQQLPKFEKAVQQMAAEKKFNAKIEIKNLKGVYDYSPAEMAVRNNICGILRRNFEAYGYAPLETAMLNYRELLTYKYGDDAEIVREIYKLNDQGDRDLGLRFDLTVPFCKYIALNRNLKMPFKRYEFGKVFRNGPVKSGRNREFWQCDVDVVGDGSAAVEAELIQMAVKCYTEMGIVPSIQIGNRKLLVSLIKKSMLMSDEMAAFKEILPIAEELITDDRINGQVIDTVIGIIDKIQKVDKSETLKSLTKYIGKTGAEKLMEYVGYSLCDIKKLGVDAAEIETLFALLKQLGVENYCVFTPSLARGLNVYTGTVWEVLEKSGRYSSSLGGGGRYDNIITDFIDNNLKYPAVGISFGLEPITAVLSAEQNKKTNIADLLAIPLNTYKETNYIIEKLRGDGVNVMLWTANEKAGKALEYANAAAINHICVIGENEIRSGAFEIKNMVTGKTKTFNININTKEIKNWIKNGH
jgi:histidyl-tRNA synthetase